MTAENPESYDLTSSLGVKQAIDFLKNQHGLLTAVSILGPILGPVSFLAKKAIDHFNSRAPTAREQQEIAIDLLKKGKELGLSEIEIILDSEAGLDIAAKLPAELKVELKFHAGKNTTTTIRAMYRDA